MVSHVKGCLYSWVYFWFSMFRWFSDDWSFSIAMLKIRYQTWGLCQQEWACLNTTDDVTPGPCSPTWIDCQLILRTIFGGQNGWIDAGKAESCWVLKNIFLFPLPNSSLSWECSSWFLTGFFALTLGQTEFRSFSLKSIVCVDSWFRDSDQFQPTSGLRQFTSLFNTLMLAKK